MAPATSRDETPTAGEEGADGSEHAASGRSTTEADDDARRLPGDGGGERGGGKRRGAKAKVTDEAERTMMIKALHLKGGKSARPRNGHWQNRPRPVVKRLRARRQGELGFGSLVCA